MINHKRRKYGNINSSGSCLLVDDKVTNLYKYLKLLVNMLGKCVYEQRIVGSNPTLSAISKNLK